MATREYSAGRLASCFTFGNCFSLCLALLGTTSDMVIAQTQSIHPRHQYSFAVGKANFSVAIIEVNQDRRRLLIKRNGIILLDREGYFYDLYDSKLQGESTPEHRPRLCDITGDGVPEVIVRSWSGGAHCCYVFDIFSLNDKLDHIWHHNAVNGHLSINFPKDQLPRLAIEDATFAYFGAGGFREQDDMFPKIPLRWNGVKFTADVIEMRKSLNRREFNSHLNIMRKQIIENPERVPNGMVTYLLKLTYSGHKRQAERFMQQVWPDTEIAQHERRQLHSSFCSRLKQSPFISVIESL